MAKGKSQQKKRELFQRLHPEGRKAYSIKKKIERTTNKNELKQLEDKLNKLS